MRHLITIACLAVSLALYCAGLESGAAALMALGGLFEIVFWKRVMSKPRLGNSH
jgi:hypothetical protein